MVLEYLPAAPVAPRQLGRGNDSAKRAPTPSSLMKVTGLPKDTDNQELVTCLRSYGVLGLAEVIVTERIGLVRFHTPQNVEAALSKADGASLKGEKLSLRPIGPAEWRELEGAGAEGMEYNGGWEWGDQGSHEWEMRESKRSSNGGRERPRPGGYGIGGSWHSPSGDGWERDGQEVAGRSLPLQAGTAGLGGQKASRGMPLPASAGKGQQGGGASSGGSIRPRPWGSQESTGGGSSSSGGGVQAQSRSRSVSVRPAGARADESAIPAAFRAQAQARSRAAKAEVESRDSWRGPWGSSGDPWGGWEDGPAGGGYRGAASKGAWSAGWDGEDRGWGGSSKGAGGCWVRRDAPY